MNREQIIHMAREAGLVRTGDKWVEPARWGVTELVHFAALINAAARAEENEACAKVCEETTAAWTQHLYNSGCVDCATAIRARGQA
jgi:hypothetical protein